MYGLACACCWHQDEAEQGMLRQACVCAAACHVLIVIVVAAVSVVLQRSITQQPRR